MPVSSPSLTKPVSPKGSSGEQLLADVAYEALEEMIVTRQLPPGAMVSEVQLAAQLGMGRTPLREALQRLRQIGFVEMHPRRGTLVAPADIVDHLDLLEVRKPLEDLVARCAAVRASDSEREKLAALAEEIEAAAESEDMLRFFKANRQIHDVLPTAAHNSLLRVTIQPIHARSRQFWYQFVERDRGYVQAARLHASVLLSVAARDSAAAALAAGNLMIFLGDLTRSTLKSML